MNIIVPMAGAGKRMRPHTLTTPKPLLPVAGKSIVEWLLIDIAKMNPGKLGEIAFVTGHFGQETEIELAQIAKRLNCTSSIHYQQTALGTAHAILCAKPVLKGPVIIAFADTLFKTDFQLDKNADGVIWVKKVEDPRQFGVVKLNKENVITDFVEKPSEFVSDLAIIGIYFFKDGENLCKELEYLIENNIKDKGEYQLTNAMENMKKKGLKLLPGKVDEWLDFGNVEVSLSSHKRYLDFIKNQSLISQDVLLENTTLIQPVSIGAGTKISNSVIGPHISIGKNCHITNSIISNSMIRDNSNLTRVNLENSMIGNHTEVKGVLQSLNLGDYSTAKS
ncbi:MAG: nucleotidyltransferase [Bacteroidetes bacterium RIFCSPLOWO2_02_FULL_36_8]|nr:MAG: nucleotidyltransferase [Bacteroidetes bacterium RIFCSPLOWO2_02_FULL_36_8]OFY68741.1 MAG: nucleotidyltransferase [Bacteroidetes bacterium RIFCSPLOWO2_12_FULL_37_12]